MMKTRMLQELDDAEDLTAVWISWGGTHKFLMNSTPNRYISRAPMRKLRKQSSVIG